MRIQFSVVLIVLAGVLNLTCNKAEPIPSYIHIDKIKLVSNFSTEGSASNKIIDAWIYVDDNLVGAFEMPCTVPVLYVGEHKVKVLAGVKENGISDTRIPYPFYYRFEQNVVLEQGKKIVITPLVNYSQGANFSFIEDFEGASHIFCNTAGKTDSVMVIPPSSNNDFEGTGSGFVSISSGDYVGITCNKYTFPKDAPGVLLELDYNCNTDLNVGFIGYDQNNNEDVSNIAVTLRPTSGWNKVYVNFTKDITQSLNSTQFSIFFSMSKNPDLSTSFFRIDNVKLIY